MAGDAAVGGRYLRDACRGRVADRVRTGSTLSGAFEVDDFALLFKGLFCVIGLIVLAISFDYFRSGSTTRASTTS